MVREGGGERDRERGTNIAEHGTRRRAEHGCHFININKEQLVIVENPVLASIWAAMARRGRHLKSSNSTGVEKLDG